MAIIFKLIVEPIFLNKTIIDTLFQAVNAAFQSQCISYCKLSIFLSLLLWIRYLVAIEGYVKFGCALFFDDHCTSPISWSFLNNFIFFIPKAFSSEKFKQSSFVFVCGLIPIYISGNVSSAIWPLVVEVKPLSPWFPTIPSIPMT